jgi:hypothetical protein
MGPGKQGHAEAYAGMLEVERRATDALLDSPYCIPSSR